MNKAQMEAIRRAMEIINLWRGNSNKVVTLIDNIPNLEPAGQVNTLNKCSNILKAVDNAGGNAIEYLTAAINDKDYPV